MSRLPFELLLALRYLRPKRTFVSVITFISVVGVALGVSVLIIVISVMSGFDKQMRDTILGFNAHLHVFRPGSTVNNYRALMKTIETNPEVKSVAPFVFGPVLAETQEGRPAAPDVRGVDPENEARVSTLPRSIVEGTFDVSGHGILVGNKFAEKMELTIGDRLNVYALRELEKMRESQRKGEQLAINPTEYEVRGIFDVGYYEFNANVVAVSLENAQEMYNLGDSVQGLSVVLHDAFRAQPVQEQLEKTLGPGFHVTTWFQESSLLASVIVEKNLMLYILFFIVIVAAFGITCTLITFIFMKTREVGLMKALGASNRQVMWVFMAQSIVVSLLGVAAGVGGGLLAVAYRNEFLRFLRSVTGMDLMPAEIYGFTDMPALVIPGDIAIICGGSLLICLVAAAMPARYASRMNPVEALRYE